MANPDIVLIDKDLANIQATLQRLSPDGKGLYAYNPEAKTYHRVIVQVNAGGMLTLAVDQEHIDGPEQDVQ